MPALCYISDGVTVSETLLEPLRIKDSKGEKTDKQEIRMHHDKGWYGNICIVLGAVSEWFQKEALCIKYIKYILWVYSKRMNKRIKFYTVFSPFKLIYWLGIVSLMNISLWFEKKSSKSNSQLEYFIAC